MTPSISRQPHPIATLPLHTTPEGTFQRLRAENNPFCTPEGWAIKGVGCLCGLLEVEGGERVVVTTEKGRRKWEICDSFEYWVMRERILRIRILLFPSPEDGRRGRVVNREEVKRGDARTVRAPWADEAHFWLNGYVNKQNCRIWSEANPQVYVETPLHPEKLTVWCALWAGGFLLQKR
ncbi:hypothetical protein TNCV_1316441 [Trichonephila clavipes]|nr:hypothetical protein TNCV_1316441 [Trichonephila clavipes]